ncbi:iron chelate uptake ABC transporter family permease subunit [Gulosibacter molinativorax]|uniref:Enterochelin ABC transporter permease n=1 Tax=Gulosibacter molinativorax TaxID=256821 RepID=A0ABT7C7E3_9MICO|nr:iron chelate uptake ABC transporter family permease subunit [Gulosibacter molinativorax]MDJ1371089.1 enterochelin ABC transporter permease [Gulosibacter molinativorax]QUY61449.1 ABC-type enterochelin transport system, permease component [Gulosibacter molinativorax]
MAKTSTTPAPNAGNLALLRGPFKDARAKRGYWVTMAIIVVVSLAFAILLLAWDNPMPFGTREFWLIAERRFTSVIAMAIVAFCHATATVAFQTITNNRIITPSLLGFESLYTAINTGALYLFGVAGLVAFTGIPRFLVLLAVMVLLASILYGWLLSGRFGNMQIMLLVGIIVGGGLGSISTFMQRLLTPSEFDLLTARLFGSVKNADPAYFPIAIPLVIVAGALLYMSSRKLNIVALGHDIAVGLGINHKALVIRSLVLITILMATSTALVGPMTFLGFLVATLAYQFANTYDHRYVFPMAFGLGFLILTGAYFIMNHVFYAQGVVSIIIELVGGVVFLAVIMKRGRL